MKNCNILGQFQGFLDTPDIFPENRKNDFRTFKFPKVNITEELITDLEKLNHPRNSVLGKRMESFFEIAIQHSDRYELLRSNIQIFQELKTMGELDFLLFDKQADKTLHVELVYKLYVYDQSILDKEERWIGPNRKDSFPEKLSKLHSRQFPLLYKKETIEYLSGMGLIPEEIEQQLCFKAQLYLPDTGNFKELEINEDCVKGTWFTFKDFKKMNWQNNLFFSPKKNLWSCKPENNSNWISYSELLKEIEILFENKKAPLVWMKSKNSYSRFFIVWW